MSVFVVPRKNLAGPGLPANYLLLATLSTKVVFSKSAMTGFWLIFFSGNKKIKFIKDELQHSGKYMYKLSCDTSVSLFFILLQ